MVRFTELNPAAYGGAVVIIDIDGTLTNDRNPAIAVSVKQHLRSFAEYARVYLCSNSDSTARFWELARETGTTYIGTPLRKPDPRILKLIPDLAGKRLVVIGDKVLTDGRFAERIGAEFVQIERITHRADRVVVSFTYMLDDIFSGIKRAIGPVAPYIELMRPLQWVKNLLVFAPLFFAGKAFELPLLGASIIAYVVFSLASSAVYVLNDLTDVEHDRLHPRKRHRPIARGAVHETKAVAFIAMLLSTMIIALTFEQSLLPVALIYIALNTLYSYRLKHVAVVDITLVSFFYLLRIVAGGLATGLPISPWIVLCVLFASLFIVAGKRRAEAFHKERRLVLDDYSVEALDSILTASAGLAMVSYGLYSILGHDSPYLVFSSIFVIFAILRMLNDIYMHPQLAETPEKLVFKDYWILSAFIGWVGYVFVVFYFV